MPHHGHSKRSSQASSPFRSCSANIKWHLSGTREFTFTSYYNLSKFRCHRRSIRSNWPTSSPSKVYPFQSLNRIGRNNGATTSTIWTLSRHRSNGLGPGPRQCCWFRALQRRLSKNGFGRSLCYSRHKHPIGPYCATARWNSGSASSKSYLRRRTRKGRRWTQYCYKSWFFGADALCRWFASSSRSMSYRFSRAWNTARYRNRNYVPS